MSDDVSVERGKGADVEGNEGPPPTAHQATLGSRALFPRLHARAFLNHAAISPSSLAVQEQVQAFVNDYAEGGVRAFMRWLPQKSRLKEKVAGLFGGEATDYAFVPNTTTGVSNIALCMPWQKGDRILLFEGDFPANITPWQQAAKVFDLEVEFLSTAPFRRSHEEGLAYLEEQLRRPARLIAASLVRFQTGFRMPIGAMTALAHGHGAELFVDAIQGAGVVPFSFADADYVACGGHKWLMGLEGFGLLYVAPEAAAALVPRVAGWLSHENALDFLFMGEGHLRHDRPIRREASTFELGAGSGVGAAALEASLDLIGQLGVTDIFTHVQRYHDALEPVLTSAGLVSERAGELAGRSGSLSVRVPHERLDGGPVELSVLSAALGERGVATTTPDGRLRFAPHWPNALDEVALIEEVLPEALDAAKRA